MHRVRKIGINVINFMCVFSVGMNQHLCINGIIFEVVYNLHEYTLSHIECVFMCFVFLLSFSLVKLAFLENDRVLCLFVFYFWHSNHRFRKNL